MDPNTTVKLIVSNLNEMISAKDDEVRARAEDAAVSAIWDLSIWLDGGGFKPRLTVTTLPAKP